MPTMISFVFLGLLIATATALHTRLHKHVLNPCDNYCQNGGSCISVIYVLFCKCSGEYTGKKCEIPLKVETRNYPQVKAGFSVVCGGKLCSKDNNCTFGKKCYSFE